jgi:integrase/recombinase XerD
MNARLPAVIEPEIIEGEFSEPAPHVPVRQADTDRHLIELWLGKHASRHTRRNYARQAHRFLVFVQKPLAEVRLGDLQAFAAALEAEGQASATRATAIAALKSLFTFAQEAGYLRFNVGAALKAPPVKNTLAERILAETDVVRMLALEPNRRNRALLTLLYGAGLRISEPCGLKWRDLAEREGGAGQVTIYGKGGRTRVVLLSAATWRQLVELRSGADPDAPVFVSRTGGHLDPSAVHRIVKAAAKRAGISAEASAHWLRHAHASHSLERGAPIHLVQATLGHASVATTGRYLHARPTDSSARYLGV